MRRQALLLTFVAALWFAAAAAGGATPARSWLKQVCGSLGIWTKEVHLLDSGLRTNQTSNRVREKALMIDWLGSLINSTQRMVDRVDSAGAPAIAYGPSVARRFHTGLTAAVTTLRTARTAARTLDVRDRNHFQSQTSTIAFKVAKDFLAIGDSLNRIDAPGLTRLEPSVKECAFLLS